MDLIVERCAGLDVHRDSVVATVRVPGKGKSRRRRAQQTRTFGTTIAQLERLADWLQAFAVTLVGMEATGVYWKPVFSVLERRFECWLINAEHLHNVPGRKSDVIDSRWLCELLELGLVRPSFVPPPPIRRLRDLTRLRSSQAEERTRAIQRLEKVLQDAGIKLSSVASGTYSASARAILEALLAGVSDPAALAELAKGRLRAKIPELSEALANRFELAHHGVLVAGLLAHIDALDQAIASLDARVAAATDRALIELLTTIPGVQRRTAEVIIAETGGDMSAFPGAKHLASWAGICPGNDESAGKRRSGRTRKGSKWLRAALTEAAKAASRTRNTYLAAHYQRLRARRGHNKATTAVAHSMLVAAWHILTTGQLYTDPGPDYFTRRDPARTTRRLVAQLERLAYNANLQQTAA
jgi:transposase